MSLSPASRRLGVTVLSAGLACGLWLGGSWYAAGRIESCLRDFAAKPSSETGLRVLELQHHAGMLQSSGLIRIQPLVQDSSIRSEDIPTVELSYQLSNLILPGSAARLTWVLRPSGEMDDALARLFGNHFSIQGDGHLTYQGAVETVFRVPEIMMNDDGVRLTVSPSQGHLSAGATSFILGWGVDRFVVRGNGEALELNKVALDVDLKDWPQTHGTTSLMMDRISTASGVAEGFRHQTQVNRDGDRVNVTSSDTIRSISAMGQKYTDLALELAVNGLDAASLQRLGTLLSEVGSVQELTALEEQQLRQDVRTVLTRGFSIAISRLSGTVDHGSLSASGKIELRPAQSASQFVSLDKWLQASAEITAKGDILPADQVQIMVESGYAQSTPQGIKASVSYANGALQANGRTFDGSEIRSALQEADEMINGFLSNP